jgi:hypothetical protein
MITFDVNKDNDVFINSSGDLAIVTDKIAAMRVAEHYARASRGEMIHNMDKGIPFWPIAFGANANIAQYEAAFRARMKQIPQVKNVVSFDVEVADNALKYTATIETIYGLIEVDNDWL